MPCHNAGAFLQEALDSILFQTFQDFELVVVDDGSEDDSSEVLEEFRARDSRIRVLTKPRNEGIVASLNTGLDSCRGCYVARMDADDIALPDRLARQIEAMDASPRVSALGGAVCYIDSAGKELGYIRKCRPDARLLLRSNPMLHPTVMIRREVVERNSIRYRQRYIYAEDYYFWLELSRAGRLAALDEVVLKYRVSDGATRFRRPRQVLGAALRVKRDAVLLLHIRPGLLDVVRFVAEASLLLLPSALIARIYRRFVLGIGQRPASNVNSGTVGARS